GHTFGMAPDNSSDLPGARILKTPSAPATATTWYEPAKTDTAAITSPTADAFVQPQNSHLAATTPSAMASPNAMAPPTSRPASNAMPSPNAPPFPNPLPPQSALASPSAVPTPSTITSAPAMAAARAITSPPATAMAAEQDAIASHAVASPNAIA